MSKNYDGWSVKNHLGYLEAHISPTRKELIRWYENGVPGLWRKVRRRGYSKAVKVRLVEVKDSRLPKQKRFIKLTPL